MKAKVIKNIEVAQKYYKILLSCPQIAKIAKPGQFIEIKVLSIDDEPFLRRPFSIHRRGYRLSVIGYRTNTEHRTPATIEILYEVIGKGTEILSHKKRGEYLDVIGPLGNGFDYRSPQSAVCRPILVAGGMGIAPLIFLAEKLVQSSPAKAGSRNLREKFKVQRRPLVLLGVKTKAQIICEEEFKRLGCNIKIATDDGSRGFQGTVTDLLKHLLSTIDYQLSTIYACGPQPMLKEIAVISKRYNIPAQISLEEHMACGIGACLGCVVNTTAGYKRVCKDGPVFDSKEVVW
jgi:dihydroorotate dehydrogenase electron transfer subunit